MSKRSKLESEGFKTYEMMKYMFSGILNYVSMHRNVLKETVMFLMLLNVHG